MLLAFQDVALSFESKGVEHAVLENISFDIQTGEFISIVGPSGCGKTSLLRLIVGILTPTAGRVTGDEYLLTNNPFGMVFQEPVLLPWRSAAANIKLPLEVTGCPVSRIPTLVSDALRQVGLENFADHLPRQLSGGMQQRVAIARALVTDPIILIMDEPFSALDTLTRESLNAELQRLWMHAKNTVVFVTHSLSEAVFLSDRVIVMSANPGRIREIVRIDLPRPRRNDIRDDPAFLTYGRKLRQLLQSSSA